MSDSLVGNDYSFWLCRGLAKAGGEVVLIYPENRRFRQEIETGKAQSQELLERYQLQIRAMSVAEGVIFKPEFISKDAVDYYFRAADALAFPYSRIDFSGVLQEAFAYVLATNVSNFKEVIQGTMAMSHKRILPKNLLKSSA